MNAVELFQLPSWATHHSSSAHSLCGDAVIGARGNVDEVGAVASWCHGVGAILPSPSSKQNLDPQINMAQ